MRLFLAIICILVLSCSKRDNKEQDHSSIDHYTETMDQRHALYCELSKPIYDAQKWVVEECDGAGFTSLYALACPDNEVDLSLFQNSDGRMHRSPDHSKCWDYNAPQGHEQNGSKSGFSKDHMLMRAVAAFEQGDVEWFQSIINYVNENNLEFCKAVDAATYISRCLMPPTMYVMFKDAIKKLKDQDPGPLPDEEIVEEAGLINPLRRGFEHHLDVQAIRLRGKIYGGITDRELDRLKGYAEREVHNGLDQAIAHTYGVAGHDRLFAAMDDTAHWPIDRLPSDENHCEPYLFARDFYDPKKSEPINPDWLPCDKGRTHTGTEYTFTMYVLKSSGM